MTDKEKSELSLMHIEIQMLHADLNKIEARVTKILSGVLDPVTSAPMLPESPKVPEERKHPGLQKTQDGPKDIFSSPGHVPDIGKAEILRHSLDVTEFSRR
jgi:hypothetical protein